MLTLTAIEMRKAVDTRAGFWLLVSVCGLTAGIVALQAGFGRDRTLLAVLAVAQQPISIVLPVVGLLLVTGEWSQRTGLVTFALVPVRERVVAAKVLAASVLSFVGTSVGLVCGFAGAFEMGEWSVVAQLALVNWLTMMFGTAFGLLVLRSAPALAVYYVVPLLWTLVGRLVPGLESVSPWLDVGQAREPLTSAGVTGREWAQLATSALVWIVVPGMVGVFRVRRASVD